MDWCSAPAAAIREDTPRLIALPAYIHGDRTITFNGAVYIGAEKTSGMSISGVAGWAVKSKLSIYCA